MIVKKINCAIIYIGYINPQNTTNTRTDVKNHVLIVDDSDLKTHEVERIISGRIGFRADAVTSLAQAEQWLRYPRRVSPDAIVLSSQAGWDEQAAFIRNVNNSYSRLPVLLITGMEAQASLPRQRMEIFQVLTRPVSFAVLESALSNAIRMKRMQEYVAWLEQRMAGRTEFVDIVGSCPAIVSAMEQARLAASGSQPIMLLGETGVGKELLARAIHSAGPRDSKAFEVVDCASIDARTASAYFFGHEKRDAGGFDYNLGKLREAEGGTLLLKDVLSLPAELREALLAVMRRGEITLENGKTQRFDVRFIFAQREIDPSEESLLRIQPCIQLPPLRQRQEDVLPLCEHFLAMYGASEQKFIRDIGARARQWLIHHPWPGNIKQLAHILRRAVIICESETIELSDLQLSSGAKPIYMESLSDSSLPLANGKGEVKPLRSIEEEAIRFALQQCGGSMTRAARSLGIGRSTLYRKVSEMNIKTDRYISRANQTTRPTIDVSSTRRS